MRWEKLDFKLFSDQLVKIWLQNKFLNLNSHPNAFVFLKSNISSFITKLS